MELGKRQGRWCWEKMKEGDKHGVYEMGGKDGERENESES